MFGKTCQYCTIPASKQKASQWQLPICHIFHSAGWLVSSGQWASVTTRSLWKPVNGGFPKRQDYSCNCKILKMSVNMPQGKALNPEHSTGCSLATCKEMKTIGSSWKWRWEVVSAGMSMRAFLMYQAGRSSHNFWHKWLHLFRYARWQEASWKSLFSVFNSRSVNTVSRQVVFVNVKARNHEYVHKQTLQHKHSRRTWAIQCSYSLPKDPSLPEHIRDFHIDHRRRNDWMWDTQQTYQIIYSLFTPWPPCRWDKVGHLATQRKDIHVTDGAKVGNQITWKQRRNVLWQKFQFQF